MVSTVPSGFRRIAILAVAASVVALTVTVGMMVRAQSAPASGWNIVTSANASSQESDLLLGTTCANAWSCWAVGATIDTLDNGQPSAMIQHWNGSGWTIDPSGSPAGVQVSLLWGVTCTGTSNCWAVGAQQLDPNDGPVTLAEHWNGTAWSVVPTPATSGILFSVTCAGASDCWASGTTETNSNNSNPLNGFIDHWDGSSWTQVPTQPSGQTYDQFTSVTCTSASSCWAVGFAGPNALTDGFLPNVVPNVAGDQAFIEHWNGVAWTMVQAPTAAGPLGSYLDGVACAGPSECWAVGATMDANGNPSTTLVDRWDGSTWATVPSPDPSTPADLLTSVTCLTATACWAAGADGVSSGQNQGTSPGPFMASWNGTAWSIEPSPNVTAFGYLAAVACVAGSQCFAAGLAATTVSGNLTLQTMVEQLVLPPAGHQGFWMAAGDGGVFTFGRATFHGSLGGRHLNAPIVGMAPTPDSGGYWLVSADGGVFTFGDATFHGSLGAKHLQARIVGMAPSPDGGGYLLVSADGGVFALGDASFWGSLGGRRLNAPIVGMAPTPDGAATGWPARTAGCSPSATPPTTGRCPGSASIISPRSPASWPRRAVWATGWWAGTARPTPTGTRPSSDHWSEPRSRGRSPPTQPRTSHRAVRSPPPPRR